MLFYRRHKDRTQPHKLAEGPVADAYAVKAHGDHVYVSCYGVESSYFGLKLDKTEAQLLAKRLNALFPEKGEIKEERGNGDDSKEKPSIYRVSKADIPKLLG